jgi:hypothetical protein
MIKKLILIIRAAPLQGILPNVEKVSKAGKTFTEGQGLQWAAAPMIIIMIIIIIWSTFAVSLVLKQIFKVTLFQIFQAHSPKIRASRLARV